MLQNCPVFNDGVWEGVKDDPADKQIVLAEGKPLVFANGTKGIKLGAGIGAARSCDVVDGDTRDVLVHTEKGSTAVREPARAARAAGLPDADGRPLPPRQADLRVSSRSQQVDDAIAKQGEGDLNKLMYSGMIWEVGADGTRH